MGDTKTPKTIPRGHDLARGRGVDGAVKHPNTPQEPGQKAADQNQKADYAPVSPLGDSVYCPHTSGQRFKVDAHDEYTWKGWRRWEPNETDTPLSSNRNLRLR